MVSREGSITLFLVGGTLYQITKVETLLASMNSIYNFANIHCDITIYLFYLSPLVYFWPGKYENVPHKYARNYLLWVPDCVKLHDILFSGNWKWTNFPNSWALYQGQLVKWRERSTSWRAFNIYSIWLILRMCTVQTKEESQSN